MQQKYAIEMDSLKEGFRVVVKSKVLKEWRKARFTYYEECRQRDAPVSEDLIDTQVIEAEIDQCILDSYQQTIDEFKRLDQEDDSDAVEGRSAPQSKLTPEEEEEEEERLRQAALAKSGAGREQRMLQRKNTIMKYKPSAMNLAPRPAKNARRKMVKHASTVELTFNSERQREEEEF